jgi:tripartite-type tricarboxylate transporter receptor subunit TctC
VKSSPDGYTLLLGANPLAIAPAVYPNLPYDPRRDLAPINLIGTSPEVLVVNPAADLNSVADLISRAKKTAQRLNYGSAGLGTLSHLASEDFNRQAGLNAVHIPFKGGALPLLDLMASRVDWVFDGVAAVQPHVKAGKLRALAIAAAERSPQLPGVPTFAEAGLPKVEFSIWVALAAPAGTPEAVLRRIDESLSEALRDPGVRKTMDAQGWDIPTTSRADFVKFLDREMVKLGGAARAAGVKPE